MLYGVFQIPCSLRLAGVAERGPHRNRRLSRAFSLSVGSMEAPTCSSGSGRRGDFEFDLAPTTSKPCDDTLDLSTSSVGWTAYKARAWWMNGHSILHPYLITEHSSFENPP